MGFKTKIKTSSPRVLNTWLLFATIMVIVLFLLFYSVVYVRNNEEQQIAKRFRVLTQIGENVVAREKGFRSIAENEEKGAKEKLGLYYSSLEEALDKETRETNKILKVAEKDSSQENCILIFREVADSPYIIFMRVEDFFDPLRRPDVFVGLIVLEEKEKNTETDKNSQHCVVIYHTFPGDIDFPGFENKNPKMRLMQGLYKKLP
jgi:hypothetical protein